MAEKMKRMERIVGIEVLRDFDNFANDWEGSAQELSAIIDKKIIDLFGDEKFFDDEREESKLPVDFLAGAPGLKNELSVHVKVASHSEIEKGHPEPDEFAKHIIKSARKGKVEHYLGDASVEVVKSVLERLDRTTVLFTGDGPLPPCSLNSTIAMPVECEDTLPEPVPMPFEDCDFSVTDYVDIRDLFGDDTSEDGSEYDSEEEMESDCEEEEGDTFQRVAEDPQAFPAIQSSPLPIKPTTQKPVTSKWSDELEKMTRNMQPDVSSPYIPTTFAYWRLSKAKVFECDADNVYFIEAHANPFQAEILAKEYDKLHATSKDCWWAELAAENIRREIATGKMRIRVVAYVGWGEMRRLYAHLSLSPSCPLISSALTIILAQKLSIPIFVHRLGNFTGIEVNKEIAEAVCSFILGSNVRVTPGGNNIKACGHSGHPNLFWRAIYAQFKTKLEDLHRSGLLPHWINIVRSYAKKMKDSGAQCDTVGDVWTAMHLKARNKLYRSSRPKSEKAKGPRKPAKRAEADTRLVEYALTPEEAGIDLLLYCQTCKDVQRAGRFFAVEVGDDGSVKFATLTQTHYRCAKATSSNSMYYPAIDEEDMTQFYPLRNGSLVYLSRPALQNKLNKESWEKEVAPLYEAKGWKKPLYGENGKKAKPVRFADFPPKQPSRPAVSAPKQLSSPTKRPREQESTQAVPRKHTKTANEESCPPKTVASANIDLGSLELLQLYWVQEQPDITTWTS